MDKPHLLPIFALGAAFISIGFLFFHVINSREYWVCIGIINIVNFYSIIRNAISTKKLKKERKIQEVMDRLDKIVPADNMAQVPGTHTIYYGYGPLKNDKV